MSPESNGCSKNVTRPEIRAACAPNAPPPGALSAETSRRFLVRHLPQCRHRRSGPCLSALWRPMSPGEHSGSNATLEAR
jgi:hypothetical protein